MSEQIPQTPATPLPPLTAAEEKQWALISHLSVLINVFTGFVGVGVPLIVYLLYKDRSRYVAYHSLQSLIMQGICSFGGLLLAVLIGVFSQFIPVIGLICLPISCLFALLPVAAIIYGIYAGIQINNGQDFKYWLAGDWAQSMLAR